MWNNDWRDSIYFQIYGSVCQWNSKSRRKRERKIKMSIDYDKLIIMKNDQACSSFICAKMSWVELVSVDITEQMETHN